MFTIYIRISGEQDEVKVGEVETEREVKAFISTSEEHKGVLYKTTEKEVTTETITFIPWTRILEIKAIKSND